MKNRILGISAFYHDSAAALVADGRIIAAAQEERFTRIKHDQNFPAHAVEYCLREAGLQPDNLDGVVFYDKPMLKFERLLETYLAFAPAGLKSFMQAMPIWLKTKLHLPREIRKSLGKGYKGEITFMRHHESHAASAFFPSPYDEAAILTMDGVGEWDTASIGMGRGNKLEILKTLRFPHSLGLLYSAFTYFCGFRVNSGEYKLMGLAPYGEPKHVDLILKKLVDLKPDGSLAMDLRYFDYCTGQAMTSREFDKLFGGPPRKPEALITQREMDLAASIQKVTEEAVLRMARHAREITGAKYLCLAGGVALNCVANGVLLRSKIFDDIWITPAAGDAGGALGAALFMQHQLLDAPRQPNGRDSIRGGLIGPEFRNEEIAEFLKSQNAPHHFFPGEAQLLKATAEAMASEKVVGWFQGRMEFGPRALGCRSIIGDARSKRMQSQMNLRIKFRESFRPFAPCVLREDASKYFDLDRESPYMLLVADVCDGLRTPLTDEQKNAMQDPDLRKRVNVQRSSIPAVTHVDFSARIQTVDGERHGRFYRLIREFKQQTGCSVIINTSFNIRGEPIVCTPQDAYRCFLATDMDVLVLENHVLYKTNNQNRAALNARNISKVFRWINQGMINPFKDVNWNPTVAEKRKFAFSLIYALPVLAVSFLLFHRIFHHQWRPGFIWMGGGGIVLGSILWLLPPLAKPFYVACYFFGCCMGFVIGNVIFSLFFFLIFTPLGLALRLANPKAFSKRPDKSLATYWQNVGKNTEPKNCHRQF